MEPILIDYEINSKVYFIEMTQIPHVIQCPICLGEKDLFRKNGTKVKCYNCNGTGVKSESGSLKFTVSSGNLHRIYITIDSCKRFEYVINVGEDVDYKKPSVIYKTEQEALADCEKMNSLGMMGYTSFNSLT